MMAGNVFQIASL